MTVLQTYKHSSVPTVLVFCLEADVKPVVNTRGETMPAGSECLETDTGDRYVFNGTSWIRVKISVLDSSTYAITSISDGHSHIHDGEAYSAHSVESDFDKSQEINVCFTTPNSAVYLHCIPFGGCSNLGLFKMCEGATVTAATGTDVLAKNRNRNVANESVIVSTKDGSSYKYTMNATVTNDGTIIDQEMVGANKQGANVSSARDTSEYVLKANTTYAFRLIGNGVGSDNAIASMEITWYEHVDKE